jgi:ATPase
MAKFGDHPPIPDALENLLSDLTVSTVFLKADCPPRVKRGHITELEVVELEMEEFSSSTIEEISQGLDITLEQHSETRGDCFVEIDRHGCKVMQVGDLRVTISWPPFSDGWEMIVVRPVAQPDLDDYNLDENLLKLIADLQNQGTLVSGMPGSGKSTLASAIARWLDGEGAVVKTMESPRDLQLPQRVTQYAPLAEDDRSRGSMELTADILFLARPDFIVYDEVRKTKDFEVFGDCRLAGLGLLGVTHSASALEAIQRMIGRVELGILAQILTTVIHVEKGKIGEVLQLAMTVKAPSGMQSDLARPVIQVKRYPDGKVWNEIFSFGEQICIVDADGQASGDEMSPMQLLAAAQLKDRLSEDYGIRIHHVKFSGGSVEVYVDDSAIGVLVGQGGSTVKGLEEQYEVKVSIKSAGDLPRGFRAPENKFRSSYDMDVERSMGGRAWEQSYSSKKDRRAKRKGRRR